MASQDANGVDRYNLNEVVDIRGDKYAFGTFSVAGGYLFVIFQVDANSFSLFPLTRNLGIGMESCDVTDVKTLEQMIQRIKDFFLPDLNTWLAKKYPGAIGTPTVPSVAPVVLLGDKAAAFIRITEGPNGPVASI